MLEKANQSDTDQWLTGTKVGERGLLAKEDFGF